MWHPIDMSPWQQQIPHFLDHMGVGFMGVDLVGRHPQGPNTCSKEKFQGD